MSNRANSIRIDLSRAPLYLILLLGGSSAGILITSYPQIEKYYNLNNTILGSIMTFYFLFSFIGSIIWANLMDRLGRKKVFFIGGFIWTFALLINFIPMGFYLYLIVISCIGLGTQSSSMVIFNEVADYTEFSELGKSNSYLLIMNGFGTLLGIAVSGLLEDRYDIEWMHLMGVIGILSLILYLILMLMENFSSNFSPKPILYDSADENGEKRIDKKSTGSPITGERNEQESYIEPFTMRGLRIKEVCSDKINRFLLLACLILYPINSFNNIWLQKFYIDVRGIGQLEASISFIFTSGAEFLGVLTSGYVIDSKHGKGLVNKGKIAFISLLIAGPLFLIGYLVNWHMVLENANSGFIETAWNMFLFALKSPDVFLAYVSLFIGFFALSFVAPDILVIARENNREGLSSIMINLIMIINSLSLAIGPVLGGYIGDTFNLQKTLLLCPISHFIVAGIFYLIIRVAKNKGKSYKDDVFSK